MSRNQEANDWYGTRTVTYTEFPCGFCRDKFHENCAHEIAWYDKLWICPCHCNKDWKPKQVEVSKPSK